VTVRVGSPGADDIFRTHPDPRIGWLDVNIITIKKGFGQDVRKKTYLAGPESMKNPAVMERMRAGYAILTVTAEGVPAVWVIARPDRYAYEMSYPFDQTKIEAAEAARQGWVTLAWDREKGGHRWSVIDISGQPNAVPVWPGEHPMIVIDRAIAPILIDDPNFVEFKHLTVRKAKSND
jgi:hypothetical protein